MPDAFRQHGMVVKIESNCLEDDDSSVRIVIERACPVRIPGDLWVANAGGLAATFQIDVLHTWRREDQLDGNGRLCPFFPNNRGNGGGGVPPRHRVVTLPTALRALRAILSRASARRDLLLGTFLALLVVWVCSLVSPPSSSAPCARTLWRLISLPCRSYPAVQGVGTWRSGVLYAFPLHPGP